MLPLRGCGNFLEKVTCDKCLKVFHIVTNDRLAIVMITDTDMPPVIARESPAGLGLGLGLGVGNLVLITEIRIVNWSDRLAALLFKS